ncbi:hypothetical protein F2Q69_00053453 [Brassica cretica]|uniref:Uncharacterized protein n=1 Tax=Brassica cretica TaxID=69181 RepID=A0A8S9MWU2_BRACR|nr:hypothetical protein F2Q69_00053453 [Brassica cretica]
MFFRETRETEEDIRIMFCEAREKMRKRITLKKKSDPGQFAIPCGAFQGIIHFRGLFSEKLRRDCERPRGADCWGQNRSRRNQCLKVRKNRHERFYENKIFGKDLFLRRALQKKHETSEKIPKKVARSLRSDRARAKLGRHVATEHTSRSVAIATELAPSSVAT